MYATGVLNSQYLFMHNKINKSHTITIINRKIIDKIREFSAYE